MGVVHHLNLLIFKQFFSCNYILSTESSCKLLHDIQWWTPYRQTFPCRCLVLGHCLSSLVWFSAVTCGGKFCLLFYSQLKKIFCSFGYITIAGEGLPNLGLCLASMAFKQGVIFIVPVPALTCGFGFWGLI